jgi:hypothetical protein
VHRSADQHSRRRYGAEGCRDIGGQQRPAAVNAESEEQRKQHRHLEPVHVLRWNGRDDPGLPRAVISDRGTDGGGIECCRGLESAPGLGVGGGLAGASRRMADHSDEIPGQFRDAGCFRRARVCGGCIAKHDATGVGGGQFRDGGWRMRRRQQRGPAAQHGSRKHREELVPVLAQIDDVASGFQSARQPLGARAKFRYGDESRRGAGEGGAGIRIERESRTQSLCRHGASG